MKHTPGPWVARQQYQDRTRRPLGWIIEHSGGRIGWECTAYATTNSEAAPDDPARAANAALMAASPALLQFACNVRDSMATDSPLHKEACAVIAAAGAA